jgi:hypothetical protein
MITHIQKRDETKSLKDRIAALETDNQDAKRRLTEIEKVTKK